MAPQPRVGTAGWPVQAAAREQAYDRMLANARELGADAIVGVRMQTSTIQQAASEVVFYGTAVKLK